MEKTRKINSPQINFRQNGQFREMVLLQNKPTTRLRVRAFSFCFLCHSLNKRLPILVFMQVNGMPGNRYIRFWRSVETLAAKQRRRLYKIHII
jgi:hypothetical protein